MKLYNVPRNSKIMLSDGVVLLFHHIDGMYSVCTDENGDIYHISASEEVTVMTKDEALKLALEALETCGDDEWHTDDDFGMMQTYDADKVNQAITAIKEALAQPAQEPVAWGVFEGNLHDLFFTQAEAQEMAALKGSHAKVRPLYTAPPQREWVGLTDEEIKTILSQIYCDINQMKLTLGDGPQKETVGFLFAKGIEQALKGKNT